MQDFVPLGTGNSRFLKSVEDFKTLYPSYDDFAAALVAGTLPVDFNGVNADGIAQLGTPINKATLLQDATAALFGLTSDAVADDVLAWLGNYNLHWWSVLHGAAYSYYAEKKTVLTEDAIIIGSKTSVEYSKSITIDQDTGAVTLADPQTLATASSTNDVASFCQALIAAAPVYISAYGDDDEATIYYIPAGATYTSASWASGQPYTFAGWYNSSTKVKYIRLSASAPEGLIASIVSTEVVNVAAGETTYVYSADPDAYPNGETVDGLIYTYLGIPFENAVATPVKIATGSYVGTGTYGSSNPNSLTFGFVPKFVVIMPGESGAGASGYWSYGSYAIMSNWSGGSTSNFWAPATLNGTTLSWYYSGRAVEQLNSSGYTYNYIVIG